MKIPLNEISTPGLLRLLRDVAAELEARHSTPTVQHVHATRPVETLRVPPAWCWWMACDKLTRHAWRGAVLLHWATRCAHAALGWSLRAWQLELIEHA